MDVNRELNLFKNGRGGRRGAGGGGGLRVFMNQELKLL